MTDRGLVCALSSAPLSNSIFQWVNRLSGSPHVCSRRLTIAIQAWIPPAIGNSMKMKECLVRGDERSLSVRRDLGGDAALLQRDWCQPTSMLSGLICSLLSGVARRGCKKAVTVYALGIADMYSRHVPTMRR